MTSEAKPETLIGGMPVGRLKAALKAADAAGDDELLAGFLQGFALGFAADMFIANMSRSGERAGFFVALSTTYPEDWAKAIEAIEKAKQANK